MEPLHVSKSAGVRVIERFLVLAGILLTAGAVIASFAGADPAEVWVTVGLLLATLLFVWLILPRGLEVWPDRVRLVLPVYTWDIDLETIAEVREARPWEPYAFMGVRFATSPARAVVLRRKGAGILRPNLVISPENRGLFLEQVDRLIESARDS
jgi:hypothetical protein